MLNLSKLNVGVHLMQQFWRKLEARRLIMLLCDSNIHEFETIDMDWYIDNRGKRFLCKSSGGMRVWNE